MNKYAKLKSKVAAAQSMIGAPIYARPIYASKDNIEVRLANSFKEVKEAQKLRYQVFYEEMSARPDLKMRLTRRDIDPYDSVCDHLLVIDHNRPRGKQIVGTYRLLRQEVAEAHKGFYSSGEYDLSSLLSDEFRQQMNGRQLLELGRSCVHAEYRASAIINLLWAGIAEYLKEHNIAYMFGCASFEGTDPSEMQEALSYLHHNHPIPADFPVRALDDQYVAMNKVGQDDIDTRRARRALPPLVKGYLRLGCFIGNGAVVDAQFGTTDVFILLPVEKIASRYSKHYDLGKEANDEGATTDRRTATDV